MTKLRKLWKVEVGNPGTVREVYRPESKTKAYDIYVRNAARARQCSIAEVWVDERNGHGWQLFERINLADYERED